MAKKQILLLADDMRLNSGIATMSREIVLHTVEKFDWLQLGAAVKHPEFGKFLDISESVQKESGVSDAKVRIIANNGYGDAQTIREILSKEKIDAILHFTDPRYWVWLYEMEDEVRKQVPILYYAIWDDLPDPQWNHPYYGSCDAVYGISKQSYGIHHRVLEDNGATVAPLNNLKQVI